MVDTSERRARLGRRHFLGNPAPSITEAARSVIALHSSDPTTVFLAIKARRPETGIEDIEDALYDVRSLVRMVGMRRTLWVVPVETAPLMKHACTVAYVEAERRRTAKMVEEAGIATDGARWVEAVGSATLAALQERGEAVASELTEAVPDLGEKITFYKRDGSVLGVTGMVTRILFLLATEAKVVRARPLGTWVSSQYRWTTVEHWLGNPILEMPEDAAQETLLRGYLEAFGPVTEVDMRWWTGWTVSKVRGALGRLGATEVATDAGDAAYLLPTDVEPEEPGGPWVALLPSLDPTTMGWKSRDWYLGEHAETLFDRNGNAGPTVWVDGRIVGGWAQRKDGEVVYELFDDVGSEAIAAIEDEVARMASWTGGIAVTTRFRSPHDLDLTR